MEAIKVFTGLQLNDVLALAEALLSFPIPADAWAPSLGQQLLEQFRRELKPVKGVREVLSALTYPPLRRVVIDARRLQLSLEVTGLAELFGDRVFSAEQVEQGKPAPISTSLRLARVGARPADCIVIEDSTLEYTRRGCGGHGR